MLLHRVSVAIALCLLGMLAMSAVMTSATGVSQAVLAQGDVTRVTNGQWAPPTAAVMNQNLVSTSDVIASATVTAVADVTPSGMGGAAGNSPGVGKFGMGMTIEELTLQPKQVLLGTVPDGTIKVRLTIFNNGKDVTPPKVGDANLYFLQRTKDGYSANLTQNVQGINAVDDITKLVDEMPLTVKLTAPTGPLYFGQATPVTISLTNNTAAQIKISFMNLAGFYYASRMESWVQSMVASSPKPEQGKPMQEPFTLDANGKQTLTVYATTMAPPSLALLGPDSYVVTYASLHMEVRFSQDAAVAGQPAQNLVARSNWVDVMVGYPHTASVADVTTAPVKMVDPVKPVTPMLK